MSNNSKSMFRVTYNPIKTITHKDPGTVSSEVFDLLIYAEDAATAADKFHMQVLGKVLKVELASALTASVNRL
jgi:hypothetical protein